MAFKKKPPSATSAPAVLVVDSNKFQRRSLYRLMRAAGADRVVEALDLAAAQRVLSMRRCPAWLVVADPDRLGDEGIRKLKRLADEYPITATLLLTHRRAPAADELREQAREHGLPLLAALRKPASVEEVGSLLRRWIHEPSGANLAGAHVLTTDELSECLRGGHQRARFQPRLDLQSGHPVCCVAVPYVTHSRYGDVAAARFSRAIMQLGAQRVMTASVLRDAAKLVRSLRDKGLRARVSVDLAPEVLSEPGDAGSLDAYVRTLGVAPGDLAFGIGGDPEALSTLHCAENLARLKRHGYCLALDDANGELPVDDPVRAHFSAVSLSWTALARQRGEAQASLEIAAAIKAARSQEMATCAVDVDTRVDLDRVRRAGFDRAQGNLFSPALPADEALDWIEREERTPAFAPLAIERHSAG